MIIDFHTHCFHDKIADKALAVLERNCGVPAEIGPRKDDLLQAMAVAGVDKSVVLNIATNVHQTKDVNNFAIAQLSDEHLIPFGSVHPDDESYEAELRRLKDAGIKGIKFHPHYQGTPISSPRYLEMTRTCLEMDFLVLFHAGTDTGVPVDYALPIDSRRLLDEVSDIKTGTIILAHMGGFEKFDSVEEQLLGQNVYIDTAYVFPHIQDEQFIRMVKTHGADKILFGTDSPWKDMRFYIDKINSMPFSEAEKTAILSGNAKRLLGIE